MLSSIMSLVLQILFIVNIIFAIIIIFFEKKTPGSTLSWILVLVFLPYFGFIIYMVLGLDNRKHLSFAEKRKSDIKIYSEFFEIINKIDLNNEDTSPKLPNIPNIENLSDIILLNNISSFTRMSINNSVKIFNEGTKKYKELVNDINNAKYFVYIQYYIFRSDDLGRALTEALTNAAKRNLEVKLMIDGMGCQFTHKKIFDDFKKAGGKLSIFNPPILVRVNYRNHRKISIIDGKIGYLGGLNVGDEYLGKSKRFGFWRDSHIKIKGEAVRYLTIRFIMDWNFSSSEKIILDEKYFNNNEIFQDGVCMQIVNSGPDTQYPAIQQCFFKMIVEAERNIYIESPYFVPDDGIFEALKVQALSGKDIRIVIPANPDHLFVYGAAMYYLGQLMELGVRCYLYKPDKNNKGFTHSKLIMIDGEIVSLGTANLDQRSFVLNFETNTFIFDTKVAKAFEKDFLDNLHECLEIDLIWYNNRSIIEKIKESFSRLLSPLL